MENFTYSQKINIDEELSEDNIAYLDKLKEKEIIPFYLVVKMIKKKYQSCKTIEEKYEIINNFKISKEISLDYLKSLVEIYINKTANLDMKYFKIISKIKFSLNKIDVENYLKYLEKFLTKKEINFFSLEPKEKFYNLLLDMKNIMLNDSDNNSKLNNIRNKLSILKEIYKFEEKDLKFPSFLGSIDYQYNIIFNELIHIFNKFMNIYNENDRNEYQILNKAKNEILFFTCDISKKDEVKYIKNDNESFYYFKKGLNFILLFESILKNLDDDHIKNIKKLKIILFYFVRYEEIREITDVVLLKDIISCLNEKNINYEFIKKYNAFHNERKLTKEIWDKLTENDLIKIEINYEKYFIYLKRYNQSIFNSESIYLSQIINDSKVKYLSFEYLLKYNYLTFNNEIEENVKDLLFSIVKSNICKNSFCNYDKRFNHKKYKYIFNGIFGKEIFNEIYDNTLIIPFPIGNSYRETFRHEFTIFLNSEPLINEKNDFTKVVPIIHSKINDYYHEFFHNISYSYSFFENKPSEKTPKLKSNLNKKIINLQNQFLKQYNNDNPIIKIFDDMGDILEISLYGIKPLYFKLYSSLFSIEKSSYNLEEKKFKEEYVKLFTNKIYLIQNENLENENNKDKYIIDIDEDRNKDLIEKKGKKINIISNSKIKKKKEIEKFLKLINKLFESKFAKSILKVFPLKEKKIKNFEYCHREYYLGNKITNYCYYVDRTMSDRPIDKI